LLGTVLAGAPSTAILGTAAVLVVIGAAVYWPALALAILAFTYPFDLTTYAGPIKVTSSDALIAVLLSVLVVRQFLPNPPAIRRTKLDLPVLLFALASAASLISLTGNLSTQLIGLIKAFGGFVLFFMATQCVRDLKDALVVIGSAIGAGLIQGIQTIIPFAAGSQAVSIDTRATGTLIDPNLFAGYLVLLIPLVIAIGVSFRQWWPVLPTIGATLVLVGALAVTLSRSGWLGMIAGAFVLFALLWAQWLKLVAVAATVGACVLIVGLSGPIAERLGPSDNGPMQMLADREQVWSAAVRMTVDHPLFGVGIDNFQLFYPVYSGRDDELNHAHNLLLNIAAERGLIGLASFCVVLVVLIASLAGRVIKSSSELEHAVVVGLSVSFVAYVIHSQFDVSYYDYKVLLLFWLLLAVAAGITDLGVEAHTGMSAVTSDREEGTR
jgi:putative inorganic carbon (HCO3(-)) transporter